MKQLRIWRFQTVALLMAAALLLAGSGERAAAGGRRSAVGEIAVAGIWEGQGSEQLARAAAALAGAVLRSRGRTPVRAAPKGDIWREGKRPDEERLRALARSAGAESLLLVRGVESPGGFHRVEFLFFGRDRSGREGVSLGEVLAPTLGDLEKDVRGETLRLLDAPHLPPVAGPATAAPGKKKEPGSRRGRKVVEIGGAGGKGGAGEAPAPAVGSERLERQVESLRQSPSADPSALGRFLFELARARAGEERRRVYESLAVWGEAGACFGAAACGAPRERPFNADFSKALAPLAELLGPGGGGGRSGTRELKERARLLRATLLQEQDNLRGALAAASARASDPLIETERRLRRCLILGAEGGGKAPDRSAAAEECLRAAAGEGPAAEWGALRAAELYQAAGLPQSRNAALGRLAELFRARLAGPDEDPLERPLVQETLRRIAFWAGGKCADAWTAAAPFGYGWIAGAGCEKMQ